MISLDHWIIELGFQQLVVSEAEAMRVSDLCNQSDDLMVSVRDLIDLDFATEVRINAIKMIYHRSPSMCATVREMNHDFEQATEAIWKAPLDLTGGG